MSLIGPGSQYHQCLTLPPSPAYKKLLILTLINSVTGVPATNDPEISDHISKTGCFHTILYGCLNEMMIGNIFSMMMCSP